MNRAVWLYREPRSGSTWLCAFLSRILNRKHIFLEYYPNITLDWKPNDKHSRLLFSSHRLAYIKPVKMYDDALLLRCVRRDTFEQMLSAFFYEYNNLSFANIQVDGDEQTFDRLTQLKVSNVIEDSVKIWLDQKRGFDADWDEFTKDYPSQTLHYEDFEQGIQIEGTDIFVQLDDHGTKKLPDYKKKVFTNYDEIKYWYDKNIP